MEDYRVGFQKMFNERNNADPVPFYIGTVIQVNPLKISIQNGEAYFTEGENLKVCESLKTTAGTIIINGQSQICSITRSFNIGDSMLCYPLNNKYFVAIDKI
jgi:hypothetical protein